MTHWSLVSQAAGDCDGATSHESRRALEVLLQRYLPALRAHLRIDHRLAADDADELLQGFVADKILNQQLVALADRQRGKFRTFLLSALEKYRIDCHRRASAKKRCAPVVTLDAEFNAGEFAGPQGNPARAFDLAWGRQVVDEAVRLMQADCESSHGDVSRMSAADRAALWPLFCSRVLEPALSGAAPGDYSNLVRQLGLRSPAHAANLLVTAKRLFVRQLREIVGQYCASEAELEAEIADLRRILAGA